MQRQGVLPDVITYSALISACEKGKQPERALELFEAMQRQGVVPDVITYSALVSACEGSQQWELTSHLLSSMQQREVIPNETALSMIFRSILVFCEWKLDHVVELRVVTCLGNSVKANLFRPILASAVPSSVHLSTADS
jgi:pentatricopeptide repeat protein